MDAKSENDLNNVLISQASLLSLLVSHWQQAIDRKHSVSVFLIEVDNFSALTRKAACFNKITQRIRGLLNREDDFIARFNRKKLIFITTMLDFRQADQLAQRLHQEITKLDFSLHTHANPSKISLSIGHLTYMPEQNEAFGPLDMLNTVFDHCRMASESGGNCSKTRLHSRLLKKTPHQALANPD